MAYYAELIEEKCGGLFPDLWGFINCTIRRTCVPIMCQEVMYTRYKRCHGIKFQSVVTPDGFIACLSGPYIAKRHDLRILHESRLLEQLQELMPEDGSEGIVYSLYGDLAYERRLHIFCGFRNAELVRARFIERCQKFVLWSNWVFPMFYVVGSMSISLEK